MAHDQGPVRRRVDGRDHGGDLVVEGGSLVAVTLAGEGDRDRPVAA